MLIECQLIDINSGGFSVLTSAYYPPSTHPLFVTIMYCWSQQGVGVLHPIIHSENLEVRGPSGKQLLQGPG